MSFDERSSINEVSDNRKAASVGNLQCLSQAKLEETISTFEILSLF